MKPKGLIAGITIGFTGLYFLGMGGSMTLNNIPGISEAHQESQYAKNPDVWHADNENIYTAEDYELVEDYTPSTPLKGGAEEYILDEEKGFQKSMERAIIDECYEIITGELQRGLRAIIFDRYDQKKSMEIFFENPWPYDLQVSEHGSEGENYPALGNVYKKLAPGKLTYTLRDYSPYKPKYDDVNYNEILAILSQNDDFSFELMNSSEEAALKKFHDFISTEEAVNLYFEIQLGFVIKWQDQNGNEIYEGEIERHFPYGCKYRTYEEMMNRAKSPPPGYTYKGYFVDTVVKPFGIRELYRMAQVNEFDTHRAFKKYTNYELLNRSEVYEHTFLREEHEITGVYFKNPRDKKSSIYQDLIDAYEYEEGEGPFGRSSYYYIKDPWNLREELGYTNPLKLPGFYINDGSTVILDLVNDYYINQGEYSFARGPSTTTTKSSGCCDCSYMMYAAMMLGKAFDAAEIEAIEARYVGANKMFDHQSFCNDFGLKDSTGDQMFDYGVVRESISSGKPVVLHIKGEWEYGGVNYHTWNKAKNPSGGHFLLIVGYDADGFYLADPGKRANNAVSVPYEAFVMGGLYYTGIRTF